MCRLLLAISSFFVGCETAPECKHEKRGGKEIGSRSTAAGDPGVGKLREAVMGSEAEGFYRLLRGVTLHSCPLPSQPPLSHAHLSPSYPAPQQSPQESAGPEVSGPVGPATMSASEAATPAPESDILVDMQPLRIQLGGTKRVYQCQVEGCKEGPSTSQAAIYAHVRKVHLGVGLVCPLCSKSFFNLDVFQHHKKTHH